MIILGLDYGRAHVGIALGATETALALPLATITYEAPDDLQQRLVRLVHEHRVEHIVVGLPVTWPEDRSKPGMREEVESFAAQLRHSLRLPVTLVDERRTSRGAGELQRGGSRVDEHALAAALILQTYLDQEGRRQQPQG